MIAELTLDNDANSCYNDVSKIDKGVLNYVYW
jgi:hypothetical protein